MLRQKPRGKEIQRSKNDLFTQRCKIFRIQISAELKRITENKNSKLSILMMMMMLIVTKKWILIFKNWLIDHIVKYHTDAQLKGFQLELRRKVKPEDTWRVIKEAWM